MTCLGKSFFAFHYQCMLSKYNLYYIK